MKVLFMGTPDFAVKSLEALIENHEICAVVTQPDKPKGRGKKVVFLPVKEKALEHGLEVLQPQSAKDPEFIERLRSFNADIFVVVAYGQILTEEVLFMPKHGSINVHGSILPKYRGAGPIQWSIIDGCRKTGVTIMQMAKGIDNGDIISSEEIEILKNDTYGTLTEKMALVGAELLIKTMSDIEKGTAVKIKQDDALSTYAPMIEKETGHIDWSRSSGEIDCLIRGLSPQPGAYSYYNDEMFKIWKVEDLGKQYADGVCGEIMEIAKKGFIVKTGSGSVLVSVIQAKGGKAMGADAYMRGHKIETGIVLK